MHPDFDRIFDRFNAEYFQGRIPKVPVVLNRNLKASAGTCSGYYIFKSDPNASNAILANKIIKWAHPSRIDLHARLFEDIGWDFVEDGFVHTEAEVTLLHEMVHAFLWVRFNDNSHGIRFQSWMVSITGVDIDHTNHDFDISKWVIGAGNKKLKAKRTSFNPFNDGK